MFLNSSLSTGSAPARASGRLIQLVAAHQIALGVLFLILCGWKFTFGLDRVLDLDTSWHEARYLAWVTGHAKLPVPAEYSPLYVAFYNLERWFVPDAINLYYLHDAVVATLLPACLFAFLMARRVPFWLALSAAAYFMICAGNLGVAPKPVHFGLAIMFLALALHARLGERPVRYWLLIVTAGLLSLTRPEFLLSLIAVVAYVGVCAVLDRGRRWQIVAALIAAVPVVGALYWWGGAPLFNDKSVEAFQQHFALNYAAWQNFPGDPHNADYLTIFREVFGNAHSIPSAFLANPAAFAHHAVANLFHMPATLGQIFLGHYNVLLPRYAIFTMGEAVLLAAALVVWAVVCRQHLAAGVRGPALQRPGPFAALAAGLRRFVEKYPEAIPMGCFLIPFPIMMTVLYPRYHYAFGMGAILLGFALVAIGTRLRPQVPGWRSLIALPIVFALIPSLGSAGAALNARAGDVAVTPRPNREIVEFLRRLHPAETVRICETGWVEPYLSDRFEAVSQERKDSGLAQFVATQRISIIVADKRLRADPRFTHDPQWVQFERDPAGLGFAAHPLPSGAVVYVKDGIPLSGN